MAFRHPRPPEPQAPPPVVEARRISWRSRRREVLGAISLAVRPRDHVVLIGPNGAGKTTLLRLLAGLLQRGGGELYYGGIPYERFDRRQLARRIAYVPQIRPARIPLTARQVVEQGRYPHLRPGRRNLGRRDFEAIEGALRRVGLWELRDRSVERLSGGERQAVFIAAALAQEARVLILDEPTTHLDPRHQAEVTRILLGLKRDSETTVLAATHELRFAAQVADRVLALKAGTILRQGIPGEVLASAVLEEIFETPFETASAAPLPIPRVEAGR